MSDDDRAELLAYLRELGASPEQLAESVPLEALGPLAVELATGSAAGVSFDGLVAAAEVPADDAAAFFQALGFPDPRLSGATYLPAEVRAMRELLPLSFALLGRDGSLAIARVMGASAARVADAVVDTWRTAFEVPQQADGTPYSRVVRTYGEALGTALPLLQQVLGSTVRRHLVAAAASTWSLEEGDGTPRRDLVVGFADLVGSTSATRDLTPTHLARLVQSLEGHLASAAAGARVRVVKLLGDGAMFVAEDADEACAFGRVLVEVVSSDPHLPPVRVGLAAGPVVPVSGDYHGPVVALAARLCAAAAPDEVLAAEGVRTRTTRVAFGPTVEHVLRGFTDPVPASAVGAVDAGPLG